MVEIMVRRERSLSTEMHVLICRYTTMVVARIYIDIDTDIDIDIRIHIHIAIRISSYQHKSETISI